MAMFLISIGKNYVKFCFRAIWVRLRSHKLQTSVCSMFESGLDYPQIYYILQSNQTFICIMVVEYDWFDNHSLSLKK